MFDVACSSRSSLYFELNSLTLFKKLYHVVFAQCLLSVCVKSFILQYNLYLELNSLLCSLTPKPYP